MLRAHLMQSGFGYSDTAMEEALYETTILRQLSGLSLERIPDETTIINFRHLLEKHDLATGILGVINGYLGDRACRYVSSAKNKDGKRDPEMYQTKKGNQITSVPKPISVSMTSRDWCTAWWSRRPMLRTSPRSTNCCTVRKQLRNGLQWPMCLKNRRGLIKS